MALFNSAGGLRYHLRALRFARRHWQPFRWSIGEWLLDWEPRETTLILIGPSAGYCLQPFLFERFERMICLEPDPLARLLFKRRLLAAPLERRPQLEFIAHDCLVRFPERLVELARRETNACVLFSNVIGQIRFLLDVQDNQDAAFVSVRTAVARAIEGRSWASFHDRVSGTVHPSFDEPVISSARLTDAEVVELLYGASGLRRATKNGQLIDHLTDGFFPTDLPHAYFSWELEPGRFHMVEAVSNQANQSS